MRKSHRGHVILLSIHTKCVCIFLLFCSHRSTERLTASMPVWFQLKHSHQQPYSLLRLHPDLPITIHHCFYLPFARDGGKPGGRAWQRKREPRMVLIGFHMYWNQILIFFLFFQMGKSALSDQRRFLWGFGERGVEMSIRCTVVSCGLCIGLW